MWRRRWQPTPVLPEEFHGRRSLVGYSPWGHKESDTTDFTFTSVYMSIPISQFIPFPTFPPGNSKFVFYICDSISVL